MEPACLATHRDGTLAQRIARAVDALDNCTLCPRRCNVNRNAGQTGFCGIGRQAVVASYGPHHGEEAVLSGRYGSGTIFFSGCNLRCLFCQNHDISHGDEGEAVTPQRLAAIMLELQQAQCHNINLVTPSHVIPQVLEALPYAIDGGLLLPLVFNTSAYDRVETIQLLDGIVDIYLPDFKFGVDIPALYYCKAPDYPQVARSAIREMHRQVGDLRVSAHNRAVRGLLVRHLVMPEGAAGTPAVMRFLAGDISPQTYVNIMNQYHPCGDLDATPELRRTVTPEEYDEALACAREAGLSRFDIKERPILLGWR